MPVEERLKRRVERERNARKQAERLLEEKSLELYEINQKLRAAKRDLEHRVLERTSELENANRDLITIGAYQRGSDPRIDAAIELHPHIMELLRQPIDSSISMSESVTALQTLTGVTGEQEVADA